jgi:cell division protein DivIC
MRIKIPAWLRNKYLIALMVVFVWMLFFDKNNIIQQWRLQKQLHELRSDKQYYLEEIKRDSTDLRMLQDDPEALEKYAREKYLMKRENEDIYLVPE